MERGAATTLHAALIECFASAGMDEENAHIWAGDDAPLQTFTVPANMPDPSAPSIARHERACARETCHEPKKIRLRRALHFFHIRA